MIYYILLSFILFFILFSLFLYLLEQKITKLEQKIIKEFKEKNNQIPSIFEITTKYLNKHNEIFKEILSLKKKDFNENIFYNSLIEKIYTYKLIHNELNFIFRVCNKHKKINKDYKYLYVRDLIINKSLQIGNDLELYKKIVKKYNKMIFIKNITIIGLLIPIFNKDKIH